MTTLLWTLSHVALPFLLGFFLGRMKSRRDRHEEWLLRNMTPTDMLFATLEQNSERK